MSEGTGLNAALSLSKCSYHGPWAPGMFQMPMKILGFKKKISFKVWKGNHNSVLQLFSKITDDNFSHCQFRTHEACSALEGDLKGLIFSLYKNSQTHTHTSLFIALSEPLAK